MDILGNDAVTSVSIRNTSTGEVSQLPAQGVFLAIGHRPNTDLFQGVLHLDKEGYILPVERTMTSIAGVFAAGDVADPHYRQAITAAADGTRAAMDVRRWLEMATEKVDRPKTGDDLLLSQRRETLRFHDVAMDNG